MDMDFKQLAVAITAIAEEKNLPEETVQEVVEQALAAAYRRDYGDREQEVRVTINTATGDVDAYVSKEVVERVGGLEEQKDVADATGIADPVDDVGGGLHVMRRNALLAETGRIGVYRGGERFASGFIGRQRRQHIDPHIVRKQVERRAAQGGTHRTAGIAPALDHLEPVGVEAGRVDQGLLSGHGLERRDDHAGHPPVQHRGHGLHVVGPGGVPGLGEGAELDESLDRGTNPFI